MHWVFLGLAGAFEIGFTACLKKSERFTRLWWSLGFVLSAGVSFMFLNFSITVIPLGTAYAVWTASAPWVPRSSASSPSAIP